MQTALAEALKHTPEGREADAILRSCVHCGFCLATCPTYNLLGDELDSPRGRIYLIKQLAEGQPVSAKTQMHLDRCMTCMSCETTCPSGVRYGRLLEIGRHWAERKIRRNGWERFQRGLFRRLLPKPQWLKALVWLGRMLKPVLPDSLRRAIPAKQTAGDWPPPVHERRMLTLEGCAQAVFAPRINAATARVLDRLGISLVSTAGCCGALSYHLEARQDAKAYIKNNIDAWWPQIAAGAEAIVMTASGCGAMVKEYGRLMRDVPDYADKAARVSALAKDLSEILIQEDLRRLTPTSSSRKVAYHSPCSLQHGQKLPGIVEGLLRDLGFTLTPVGDAHLCCGSAGGPYAVLQRELSQRALRDKLNHLEAGQPDVIATANMGCLLHLQSQAKVPVRHWVELFD
ncbi:MAG: glycolate oxidase subunit GlcF [Gammaproteobacteria bacterium]|nr:glycolate oxidase subunit GlcF [Gammaproteobacteria bacterium]MCP5424273.1 glycolate oxidase subunit GlcF [Gammaproteobacteria bacterium]